MIPFDEPRMPGSSGAGLGLPSRYAEELHGQDQGVNANAVSCIAALQLTTDRDAMECGA